LGRRSPWRRTGGAREAWAERDLAGHLLPVDGANHFTILETLADPQGVLAQAFLAMLGD
jgi:hypothetical protein